MEPKIYKQLPMTRADGNCPICRQKIAGHKNVCVKLHDSNHLVSITAECRVLYCTTCALPFANASIITEARKKNNGLWFDLFTINKKSSATYIENKMEYSPKRKVSNYTVLPNNTAEIWKNPQTLISIDDNITACPKCFTTLHLDYTFVPISEKQKVKIPGSLCSKCKCLYVGNKSAVDKILRDNQYAKGFTLDEESLWNAAQMLKKQRRDEMQRQKFRERVGRLCAVESAVVMICVSFSGKPPEEFIIANQPTVSDFGNRILHYASVEAREILSAAFVKKRNRKGTYGGKDFYTVARPVYPDPRYRAVSESIVPSELNIEHGGGYYSSVINGNYEIVDLLVYSPFSNRYELMKATCNKSEKYCFVDIGLYRKFVKEHGNPGLYVGFNDSRSSRNNWDDLNIESILKGYGYSVSQADGFWDTYRQELLAEIIDLEILTIPKVIRLLDFFIRTHPSQQYTYARCKWTEDKRFVENYRANPSRFLIAKSD